KGRRQQRFHQAHLTHRLAHHRTPPSCFTRIESQQHGQGQGFAAVSIGTRLRPVLTSSGSPVVARNAASCEQRIQGD
ncbi:MAG TPA: hypothetical protein VHL31_10165, partial [Geminicoccus sp.]